MTVTGRKQHCQSTTSCTHYSWHFTNAEGYINSCFLKYSDAGRKTYPNQFSGSANCPGNNSRMTEVNKISMVWSCIQKTRLPEHQFPIMLISFVCKTANCSKINFRLCWPKCRLPWQWYRVNNIQCGKHDCMQEPLQSHDRLHSLLLAHDKPVGTTEQLLPQDFRSGKETTIWSFVRESVLLLIVSRARNESQTSMY